LAATTPETMQPAPETIFSDPPTRPGAERRTTHREAREQPHRRPRVMVHYGCVELGQPRKRLNRTKRIACVVALVVLVAACSSSRHLSTLRSTTTFTPNVEKAHYAPKPRRRASTRAPQLSRLPVGLSLVNQTTWVPLRQTLAMKLHIDDPALAARGSVALSQTGLRRTKSVSVSA
jgi:hypothetical protein